jgi:FkbM family methyltransferase
MANHRELNQEWSVEDCKALMKQPPGPWPHGWSGFPNICQAFRELFSEAAESLPDGPKDPWVHPRGVVICGGGWRFFPSLYVTVRQIRAHGCKLPIQIWYLGDRGEFDLRMAKALEPYDVGWVCANSHQRINQIPKRVMGGWEMKPYAALHAPFQEVICLDADSYPVQNPEVFIAHPEYQRVGAAFWPDQQKLEPGQWERFGLSHHDEQAFESGQYIVDKGRHYKALALADWMNDYSDYVYHHIYGDKDTFHIAWRKVGAECCIPTVHPGWDTVAFLQMDFDGRPLFCHRTRDKFRWPGSIDGQEVPKWYMTAQWNGENQFLPSLPDEAQAHRFSKESDQMIRPFLHFHYTDGPEGIARKTWDEVALYNEYKLPGEFRPTDVILDIGAHVGSFSWSCLRRGAGLAIAVEPMKENLDCLRANLIGYSGKVEILPQAVWDASGWMDLPEDPCHSPGVSSTFTLTQKRVLDEDEPSRRVETTTLEHLIKYAASRSPSDRVRMLKIDAEGGEYPGILGAGNLHLVDSICGEIHRGTTIDGVTYSTGDVVSCLEAQGFTVIVEQNGPNTDLLWADRKGI